MELSTGAYHSSEVELSSGREDWNYSRATLWEVWACISVKFDQY